MTRPLPPRLADGQAAGPPSLVSLGDLMAAVVTLRADGESTRAIAALLGLGRTTARGPGPGLRPRRAPREDDRRPARSVDGAADGDGNLEKIEPAGVVPGADPRVVASALTPVLGERVAGVTARPLPRGHDGPEARPPHRPLLQAGYARAVLSTSLSTPSDDGAIDVEALIPRLAARRPIERIPRLPRRTMRRGVQLLLDRGPALAPFARDQDWLSDTVLRMAGRDRVQVVSFFGCPSRGGPLDDDGRPTPIPPPVPGTMVLAMTDLGIVRPLDWADRVAPDEWLAVADGLARAGCPLLVLTPYPPARWPAALAARLTIVEFDRSTTVSTVRRLVRTERRAW